MRVEGLAFRVVVPVLENRKWKVVKSENILHLGEWLSVRQETVELPRTASS